MLKSFKMSFCSIKYTAVISYSDVDGVNHDYHLSRVNDSCFSDKFKTFVYTSVNRNIIEFVFLFCFLISARKVPNTQNQVKVQNMIPDLSYAFVFCFSFNFFYHSNFQVRPSTSPRKKREELLPSRDSERHL